MNSITSFIKARLTSIKPKYLPRISDKPAFVAFGNCDPVCKLKSYDWNGVLKVERAFGENEEISGQKMETLRSYVDYMYGFNAPPFFSYAARFKEIKDGGTFWDSLMFRGAGDTPIAICEHVLPIIMLHDGVKCWDMVKFTEMCCDYVYDYNPAVLNNHLTFKALFLLLSANHLHKEKKDKYSYWALGAYDVILNQIDEDGYFPLELERGDKAASYSRMNLEALNALAYLIKKWYGVPIDERVYLANYNLYCCLTDHDTWKEGRDIKKQQLVGVNLHAWAWVLQHTKCEAAKSLCVNNFKNFNRNQNAYIYNYMKNPIDTD